MEILGINGSRYQPLPFWDPNGINISFLDWDGLKNSQEEEIRLWTACQGSTPRLCY